MDKYGKIGIFDSGIGGATVLKEILKVLPNEEYIYYSDSKNNPYGDKSEEELFNICDEIVNYLVKKKCKVIVIGCNTASCLVAEELRKKYKKIPIIAIEPAYKMVYDLAYEKPTLIMATKGTIESKKFKDLYKKYNNNNTYLMICNGLADIIEKNEQDEIKKYLNLTLLKYKGKVQNVVLGCTHYPLIKEEITQVLGKVDFFYGSFALANHLKKMLENYNLINLECEKSSIEFIDSSNLKIKQRRFERLLDN